MKQLIVLISTIMLGIIIGGIVLSFSGSAQQMQQTVNSGITNMQTQYQNALTPSPSNPSETPVT